MAVFVVLINGAKPLSAAARHFHSFVDAQEEAYDLRDHHADNTEVSALVVIARSNNAAKAKARKILVERANRVYGPRGIQLPYNAAVHDDGIPF